MEGKLPDICDGIRDGDAGEARAAVECILPDFRDPGRDVDAGKARASLEGLRSDFRDTGRDDDAGEFRSVLISFVFDFHRSGRDGEDILLFYIGLFFFACYGAILLFCRLLGRLFRMLFRRILDSRLELQ